MNYGVIDLGSNSIRLSIYKYENNQISLLINKKVMAGLASYVHEGILIDKGISKACGILNHFKEILDRFGIQEMHLFATASLRNILNAKEAVEAIYKKTGLVAVILSGDEEAQLDFIGATWFYAMEKGLLLDIGGGSFELVMFEGGQIKALTSLPLGSLNLYAKYVKGLVPTDEERKLMKKAVHMELDKLNWEPEPYMKQMCGVGGTIRAALKLSKDLFNVDQQERQISAAQINTLCKMLKLNTPKNYHTFYQVVPERILSIQPGLLILNEVIKRFGTESIHVSKGGVREGYLIERVIGQDMVSRS